MNTQQKIDAMRDDATNIAETGNMIRTVCVPMIMGWDAVGGPFVQHGGLSDDQKTNFLTNIFGTLCSTLVTRSFGGDTSKHDAMMRDLSAAFLDIADNKSITWTEEVEINGRIKIGPTKVTDVS